MTGSPLRRRPNPTSTYEVSRTAVDQLLAVWGWDVHRLAGSHDASIGLHKRVVSADAYLPPFQVRQPIARELSSAGTLRVKRARRHVVSVLRATRPGPFAVGLVEHQQQR